MQSIKGVSAAPDFDSAKKRVGFKYYSIQRAADAVFLDTMEIFYGGMIL